MKMIGVSEKTNEYLKTFKLSRKESLENVILRIFKEYEKIHYYDSMYYLYECMLDADVGDLSDIDDINIHNLIEAMKSNSHD